MKYLVPVEVIKDNKAPQTLYITYSFETVGSFKPSKEDIKQFVKEYLKDIEGEKTVKTVYCLNDEMYYNFFENQLKDYIMSDE